ncbi:TIGR04282 family arsenosugar biosynthesis glycosyltransferase [Microbacterium sp. LWH3-1.2]|uniref:TIGR04282 family arsenosugar biosynthesis glycosyltransferase n=1 Tax=Microbacterium sp. LWH3-1.2 TaxID=3135256 RepID=UPI0034425DFA
MTTLVVMAKECVPGRVKTRLHPPFSLEDAARIAEASLSDTLALGRAIPVERRVLCFAGEHLPVDADGWEIVPQSEGGLDERIATALDDCAGPTLLIGMDTPQVRAEHVSRALASTPPFDAWLGLASDGGFWALGLREPDGDLVRGVPMSRADTGDRQLRRLRAAGLRVEALPVLTDIDTAESLAAVAGLLPDGQLRRLLARAA